jgi:PAS domain S-box-containing protein
VYRSTVLPTGPVNTDYTSPQIMSMLGYTPDEWKDQTLWITRIHPHDRDRVLDAWEESKAAGSPFSEEFRFLAKDGRIVWVIDETKLLSRDARGKPERFQGVMMDITARKEAEAAAVDAEARYQALASHGPVMAYVWERDPSGGGRHRYLSPQVEPLLGYQAEDWDDNDFWMSIVHPDDRERVYASEVQTEYTGEPWSLDYRVLTRAGEVRWLHDEGSLLSRDDAGLPHRFQGVYIDITPAKEMERELRESETRYRTLVEQLPAIPWSEEVDMVTGASRITYLGPQTESVLGWGIDELDSDFSNQMSLIHPDDREAIMRAEDVSREEGTWDQTFRVFARDATVRTVRSIGRCVSEPGARTQLWQGITIEVAKPYPATAADGSTDVGVSPSA